MIVVTTLDDATRPGYDPLRNWVSQLALGPHGTRATTNVAICSAWLFLYGLALLRHTRPAARWTLLCALSLAATAAIPTDAGLGFPPGTPPGAGHTPVGLIHQAAGVVVFLTGVAATLTLGTTLNLHRYARSTATVMTTSFIAAVLLVMLDAYAVWPGTPSGLLERIALFTGLTWTGAAGLLLARRPT